MIKAILGIGGGLALAGIAITCGPFFDPRHHLAGLWLVLSLLAWPVAAWGEQHFAKVRGYNAAMGCGLFALALPIYIFLVHRSHKPLVYAVGFAFAVSLPVVVLLALPEKNRRARRYRKRDKT